MIPFVAVISLRNQESRTFRLWIPLMVLWGLLLPLGALLSPFIFNRLPGLPCESPPRRCRDVADPECLDRHGTGSRAPERRDLLPHSLSFKESIV